MLLFVLVNISLLESHNVWLMGPGFESSPLVGCLMPVTEEEKKEALIVVIHNHCSKPLFVLTNSHKFFIFTSLC